ncbi:preprotein translocase subunit SecD [Methanolapillus millepedarum]|uniref:Protein-export membrane protein SecD n=1 Tax=Methanolapillus millepedarum TaxID=3028296 RepID=A0AA96ZUS4_9EURY|nr:Protein translocase subunit SecD [Methanosarcinaceae archaeon Ac7]
MMEEKKETPIYKNYKVILLVLGLLISIIAIGPGYSAEDGFHTRISYGLDIEGGSWIQLKLDGAVTSVDANPENIVSKMLEKEYPNGLTITGSSFDPTGNGSVTFTTPDPVNETRLDYLFGNATVKQRASDTEVTITAPKVSFITSYLSNAYNTEVIPYAVRGGSGYEWEIRKATSLDELTGIMTAVNGTVVKDTSGNPIYRNGTTKETMQTTIDVLNNKLGNGLGIKDLPIQAVGDEYILIDFAGVDLAEARKLVETPGKFEIRVQVNANETAHILYGDSVVGVNPVGQTQNGQWYVPFTLNEQGAVALQQAAIKAGATTDPNSHNLIMLLDDEVVYSAPLSGSAAAQLNTGPIYSWQATTSTYEEAKELQIHLRAGALPVNVEIIGSGQVDAALGEGFLKGAIITAFFAMIAVALLVYNKYRRPEIVIPMVGTSIAEVVMLLGFAALVGQELDLASIAGIIAVIGTGVDHLVIITEEVVHEGKTPSHKVYSARIGKAFFIIFGAAATTVVAMTPLVFLGFGALKGFAIVTIVGVLIGVLIARPAYSAILKYILTKRGLVDENLSE